MPDPDPGLSRPTRPSLPRRSFLTAGLALGAGTLLLPAAPAAAAPRTGGSVVVRTSAGRVAGERTGDVCVFRGVPYAAPPTGARRFASPQPPEPWSGIRDATAFGPASLQSDYPPAGADDEDCLYANVWTPDVDGRRPVLVYVHGGGWMLGSGGEPDYDGARPAARGDMVVVTFNYRLGPLGWGRHDAFTDPATGLCANWGLQDQLAAVRWARRNAAAFGGDPDNVTLAGTSAGGSSTWQLSLLPALRGVVRRIVPISAHHVWAPASSTTPAESRAVFERLAAELRTDLPGLRGVPARELEQAWVRLFSGSPTTRPVRGWREYRGPVPDGRTMPAEDVARPTPRFPTLTVYARTEGSFFTTGPGYPYPGPSPADDAGLRRAVREILEKGAVRVTDPEVDACVRVYRDAAVAEGRPRDPVSLWTEVWGDALFRYHILGLADRQAREHPSTPRWLMEFAHPARPPYAGTPHEATSKFLFGTYGSPANAAAYGDGPLERTVSDTMIDLIASFARDGVPRSSAAPSWPVHTPGRPTTLTVGGPGVAAVGPSSKTAQLRHWDTAGWAPRP